MPSLSVAEATTARLYQANGRRNDCEAFAAKFICKSGQVTILQKLMGHTKISTTMKYVHVDDGMKYEAVAVLYALEGTK